MRSDDPSALVVPESVVTESSFPEAAESETLAPETSDSETTDAETTDAATPDPRERIRAEMLTQFEHWLDQALAVEPPPAGVPEHLLSEAMAMTAGTQPAAEADLYTLFSALTALTGEIRLQGRAFKQLADLLSPLAETPAALQRLEEAISASDSDDPGVSIDQICAVVIDLYDRLQRGLQTCDAGIQTLTARAKQSWLRRLLHGSQADQPAIASVQAIRDASALTLARLQAAMQEWGVQRIGQIGEPFDPKRMAAVDVRTALDAAPGTVIAVQRSGYAIHGNVKATAQVTVSRQE